MNKGMLRTFFSDITPCQIPANDSFTFIYICWGRVVVDFSVLGVPRSALAVFVISIHNSTIMATMQMPVTSQPVVVKRCQMASRLVPVSSKNVMNTRNCVTNVNAAITSTNSESMARSVTTVPKAFGNDTPSFCRSTPHRANSPTRGITRLAA